MGMNAIDNLIRNLDLIAGAYCHDCRIPQRVMMRWAREARR